ncbi:hypothetical protein B0H14DRAFT_2754412, partial [Mycena olivaceomarginata]
MWPIALTSLFYVPLVASAALNRRPGGAQILTPAVDVFINKLFTEWNSPGGAAVAVMRMDGQGRWLVETKGYGFAKADGTKVGPETMFAIGSNSEVSFRRNCDETSHFERKPYSAKILGHHNRVGNPQLEALGHRCVRTKHHHRSHGPPYTHLRLPPSTSVYPLSTWVD